MTATTLKLRHSEVTEGLSIKIKLPTGFMLRMRVAAWIASVAAFVGGVGFEIAFIDAPLNG